MLGDDATEATPTHNTPVFPYPGDFPLCTPQAILSFSSPCHSPQPSSAIQLLGQLYPGRYTYVPTIC